MPLSLSLSPSLSLCSLPAALAMPRVPISPPPCRSASPPPARNVRNENECISDSDKYPGDPTPPRCNPRAVPSPCPTSRRNEQVIAMDQVFIITPARSSDVSSALKVVPSSFTVFRSPRGKRTDRPVLVERSRLRVSGEPMSSLVSRSLEHHGKSRDTTCASVHPSDRCRCASGNRFPNFRNRPRRTGRPQIFRDH